MQPRDEKRAGHDSRVAHGRFGPAGCCVTLEAMSALLTSRLHVDLQRLRSAICSLA